MNPPADHLYVAVANRLEALIRQQTVAVGEKMPSVRQLSQEQGVSISTAFQAYYHLEAKGLVEARPKSGYYVRTNLQHALALPAATQPAGQEQELSIRHLRARLAAVAGAAPAADLQLASAVPGPELLPVAKLKKSMQRALATAGHGGLYYEQAQGNAALRQQVVRLAFNGGSTVAADEVLITAGCLDAVALCLQALTAPGDVVAVESPTYYAFFELLAGLHLRVVEIPTDPVAGLDLTALETALRERGVRVCLFTPTFSNPLGSCLSEARKAALVALLARHQVPLIEDDIYGDLPFGPARPRTCHSFDTAGLVCLCSSFSKTLAPGYRVGWVLPGRTPLAPLARPGATLPQAALADFLAHGRYDLHLRQLRQALHRQCLRYQQALARFFPPATRVSRPTGGFVLWVELPAGLDAVALHRRALARHIVLAPGPVFTAQDLYRSCLRISFGQPYTPAVEENLRHLGQLAGAALAAG